MILPSLLFLIGLQILQTTPVKVGTVEVHSSVEDGMFPESWRSGDIDAKATPIAFMEIGRSVRLVKKALAKYPAPMLEANLKRIYLVQELIFYGVPYGATNSLDTLYLCNEGVNKGFTDSYVEGSVYHEFSSILLRNYPELWSETAWTAANPKGFFYLGNGTDAVRIGATSLDLDPKLFAQGFLTTYSKASVEDDFNVMSENLFQGDSAFWKAVEAHPALKTKCTLAVRFYEKLDPQFIESWFRKQRPNRPASRG